MADKAFLLRLEGDSHLKARQCDGCGCLYTAHHTCFGPSARTRGDVKPLPPDLPPALYNSALELQGRLKKMETIIATYGGHTATCDIPTRGICTCGWFTALSALT
jgi:hypothetical protein